MQIVGIRCIRIEKVFEKVFHQCSTLLSIKLWLTRFCINPGYNVLHNWRWSISAPIKYGSTLSHQPLFGKYCLLPSITRWGFKQSVARRHSPIFFKNRNESSRESPLNDYEFYFRFKGKNRDVEIGRHTRLNYPNLFFPRDLNLRVNIRWKDSICISKVAVAVSPWWRLCSVIIEYSCAFNLNDGNYDWGGKQAVNCHGYFEFTLQTFLFSDRAIDK